MLMYLLHHKSWALELAEIGSNPDFTTHQAVRLGGKLHETRIFVSFINCST